MLNPCAWRFSQSVSIVTKALTKQDQSIKVISKHVKWPRVSGDQFNTLCIRCNYYILT